MGSTQQEHVAVASGRCPRCGPDHLADLLGAPLHPDVKADDEGPEFTLLKCHSCGTPYLQRGWADMRD